MIIESNAIPISESTVAINILKFFFTKSEGMLTTGKYLIEIPVAKSAPAIPDLFSAHK